MDNEYIDEDREMTMEDLEDYNDPDGSYYSNSNYNLSSGRSLQSQTENVGDRLFKQAEDIQRQKNAELIYKTTISNNFDSSGRPLFQVLFSMSLH